MVYRRANGTLDPYRRHPAALRDGGEGTREPGSGPAGPLRYVCAAMAGILRREAGRAGRWAAALVAGALVGLGPFTAVAEEPDLMVTPGGEAERPPSEEPPEPPEAGDPVALDQLLQLPSTMSFDQEKRNGASRETWRARFRDSHREIQVAKAKLEASYAALDELAGSGGGGQWQMAPPGANNTEVTPMSFKLREEIREGKERVAEAERKHRELEIQADLAGVPAAWRVGTQTAGSGNTLPAP